jgi:hypothetical protein
MKLTELFLSNSDEQLLIEMPYEEAKVVQYVMNHVMRKYMKLSFDMSGHMEKRVLPYEDERRKQLKHDDVEKDKPREEDITKEELFTIFNKVVKNDENRQKILKHRGKGKEIEGTIKDHETNINIVFKVAYQHKTQFPVFRIITLMRKKGFVPKRGDIVINV